MTRGGGTGMPSPGPLRRSVTLHHLAAGETSRICPASTLAGHLAAQVPLCVARSSGEGDRRLEVVVQLLLLRLHRLGRVHGSRRRGSSSQRRRRLFLQPPKRTRRRRVCVAVDRHLCGKELVQPGLCRRWELRWHRPGGRGRGLGWRSSRRRRGWSGCRRCWRCKRLCDGALNVHEHIQVRAHGKHQRPGLSLKAERSQQFGPTTRFGDDADFRV